MLDIYLAVKLIACGVGGSGGHSVFTVADYRPYQTINPLNGPPRGGFFILF